MSAHEVVVALATPHGRSALAVVRITGSPLDEVLDRVVRPMSEGPWRPGRTRRVEVVDRGGVFDDGVAVVHRGPHTYTGEDLCEISVHGNPLLAERLVDAFVDAGARLAAPGELTRRAVVNGRLDLVRAEAVDQLIRATGIEGLRIAREALEGALGAVLGEIREGLLRVAAELEARLDWPADDLAYEPDEVLVAQLSDIAARCRRLADTYRAGRVWVDGARVALVGPVNAGKSSLFNALLGQERAIVHETAGTTRDVVEARCHLGSIEVTLLDTAGERDTADPIERMGLELGRRLVEDVDLLLVVVRAQRGPPGVAEQAILERTKERQRLVVYNGVDVPGVADAPPGTIPTSAVDGTGIERLRSEIVAAVAGAPPPGPVLASVRQRDRLLGVAAATEEAIATFSTAGVAVAADAVIAALAEIDSASGVDTRDRVLDEVFARFCIGK